MKHLLADGGLMKPSHFGLKAGDPAVRSKAASVACLKGAVPNRPKSRRDRELCILPLVSAKTHFETKSPGRYWLVLTKGDSADVPAEARFADIGWGWVKPCRFLGYLSGFLAESATAETSGESRVLGESRYCKPWLLQLLPLLTLAFDNAQKLKF